MGSPDCGRAMIPEPWKGRHHGGMADQSGRADQSVSFDTLSIVAIHCVAKSPDNNGDWNSLALKSLGRLLTSWTSFTASGSDPWAPPSL